MRLVFVPIAFLRAAPAASASNSALGAWLKIYGYAAELEAGGIIPGCLGYDDRRWLSAAGVTLAEVEETVAAALVEWRGSDLVVHGYDLEGEAKVKACRVNGKSGGRPKKGSKTQAKPSGKPNGKPTDNRSVSSSLTQAKPLFSSLPIQSSREGEGDPDPPPLPVDRDPDPYLEALRCSYRSVRGAELPDSRDLARTVAALSAVGDPEVAGEVARLYFAADGPRPDDPYWRTRSWSMHLLETQGIEALATRAQEIVADRRHAAAQQQADDERRAAEAAAREERDQRAAAELAALPPLLRAWREALGEVGRREPLVSAILAQAPAVVDGDRLVVTGVAPGDRRRVSASLPALTAAFARRAGEMARLDLELAA